MVGRQIFLSISGSDLFGIPEPADCDVRGAHLLTEDQFWKNLRRGKPKWTIEKQFNKMDFVSFEVGNYLNEMLKPNVNFIEQVLSPLSLVRSPGFEEMQDIARDCISKSMYSHWKGFAMHTSYHAVDEDYKNPKRDLYLLRIYYQGIYVAQNEMLKSDFDSYRKLSCFNDTLVQELFDCKKRKAGFFNKQNFLTHCAELEKMLQEEVAKSKLREAPTEETRKKADDLYVSLYKKEFGWDGKK
jgi:uncharacterized protein